MSLQEVAIKTQTDLLLCLAQTKGKGNRNLGSRLDKRPAILATDKGISKPLSACKHADSILQTCRMDGSWPVIMLAMHARVSGCSQQDSHPWCSLYFSMLLAWDLLG